MSTQFFDRQAQARKNTVWLVIMFVLALMAIVLVTSTVVTFVSDAAIKSKYQRDLGNLWTSNSPRNQSLVYGLLAGAITAGVICLGTLYKVVSLRAGGGRSVAESLGGKRLQPDSRVLMERRLLNIVEEMAIASGTPVPPVFLLDEDNVNAFAAGYSPSDAVIGVTRGAAEQLTREQMQGVIAHEFSHILNGDMRMNIRMIGILHGILLLALIGKLVLRSLWYTGGHHRSRSNNNKDNSFLLIVAVGIALLILGSIGSFLGGLLKAAVSRQREYLADASAVQFTRNPNGIAGALKRIGGIAHGGRLQHPGADMASHMYFAQGVFEGLTGLLATHPPLGKRIRAIEPNWDGKFESAGGQPVLAARGSGVQQTGAAGFASEVPTAGGPTADVAIEGPPSTAVNRAGEVSVELVDHAADQIGQPTDYHRRYADRLIDEADSHLIQCAREPYSGRAVMFALLMDSDEDIRERQWKVLETFIEDALLQTTKRLVPLTDALADHLRLPLVDLTLPGLASMSKPQYDAFVQAFDSLVKADNQISLFEWTLAQVLRRNLRPHFEPVGRQIVTHYGVQRLGSELSVLFSIMARVGHVAESQNQMAFDLAAKRFPVEAKLLPPDRCDLGTLNEVLSKLNRCSEKIRVQVIDACAAAICADGVVTVREAELLRGIADLLGCPVPPLIETSVDSGKTAQT